MLENIYNIFLFYMDNKCSEASCVSHKLLGNDSSKEIYLKSNLEKDLLEGKKIKLDTILTLEEENAWSRQGLRSPLVLEVFRKFGISETSLVLITPVENGKIKIDVSIEYGKDTLMQIKNQTGDTGRQIDWLTHYTNSEGIDISQLIHDDYFKAIKLTFNSQLYVSSMKLLLSCIDSVAYIEYGEKNKNPFIDWLDKYAKLNKIDITSEELWELRNGLLHMTNTDSRRVRKNDIRRISFFVNNKQEAFYDETMSTYFFNFYDLINIYADALGNWIESYNQDRDKFAKFVERYDRTVSDSRAYYREKAS